jgi:hypothetical protein
MRPAISGISTFTRSGPARAGTGPCARAHRPAPRRGGCGPSVPRVSCGSGIGLGGAWCGLPAQPAVHPCAAFRTFTGGERCALARGVRGASRARPRKREKRVKGKATGRAETQLSVRRTFTRRRLTGRGQPAGEPRPATGVAPSDPACRVSRSRGCVAARR